MGVNYGLDLDTVRMKLSKRYRNVECYRRGGAVGAGKADRGLAWFRPAPQTEVGIGRLYALYSGG